MKEKKSSNLFGRILRCILWCIGIGLLCIVLVLNNLQFRTRRDEGCILCLSNQDGIGIHHFGIHRGHRKALDRLLRQKRKFLLEKKSFGRPVGRSATTNELKFPLELDLFQNSSFTWLRTYSIEAHTWVLSDKPLQNVFFSDRNRAGNSISSFIWRDPCHFITVLGIT